MSGRAAPTPRKGKSALGRFLADQRGSHAVEFCIWLPLFVFFLAAAIDAAMIYLSHTEMWNVARDTARRMTTRELDPVAAEQHAFESLFLGGRRVYISADQEGDKATVVLRTLIADASVFGIFGLFTSEEEGWIAQTLDVRVEMSMEPPLI